MEASNYLEDEIEGQDTETPLELAMKKLEREDLHQHKVTDKVRDQTVYTVEDEVYREEILDDDFRALIDNDSELKVVRETSDGNYKIVFEGTY